MKIYKLILCSWAIGIGARFIVAYLKGYLYEPNLFDVFFDWSILLLTGLLTYVEELIKFWRRVNVERK